MDDLKWKEYHQLRYGLIDQPRFNLLQLLHQVNIFQKSLHMTALFFLIVF